jgi:hypothetical protein
MNTSLSNDSPSSRRAHHLTVTALLFTVVALLLCLLFVVRTTGGTVVAFSMLAPLLVLAAVIMIGVVIAQEYIRSHRLFEIERYPAGHVIFHQGEEGDCAYFIRSGEVEVIDEDTGATMARIRTGEYFGEMALITNKPRNATIRTVSEVELAVLGKQNFLHAMKLMPATEGAIMNTFRERVLNREGPGGP